MSMGSSYEEWSALVKEAFMAGFDAGEGEAFLSSSKIICADLKLEITEKAFKDWEPNR